MKRIYSFGFSLFLALAMLAAKPAEAQLRVGVSINFQTFYDELSPYGDWIDYPDYGYTWRPRVGSDFRPYATNGYWAYTDDYDWMWNSEYDWGWAPFHYGRWFYDPYYGWLWVPDYEWSPAWVAWRGGDDYYGWAPLRPGFSISMGFGNYNPGYDYWTFAPCRYMNDRYISRYYYPYRNNFSIFGRTNIINNYYGGRGDRGYGGGGRYDARRGGGYYSNGPLRNDVERHTGRISSMRVRDMDNPGLSSVRRNEISVYRPTVQRTEDNGGRRYSPREVQNYDRNVAANRGDAMRGRADGRNGNVDNNVNRNVENGRAQRNGNIFDRNRQVDQNSRGNDVRQQRQQEMQNRNNEMIQQRDRQVNEQRSMEMRQQRQQEMQNRNNEMIQQRDRQVNEQRSMEMRQQRQQEMQNRNNEMMQQRQQQMQQRESQMRSREVQAAPQRESRSYESRSADRPAPAQRESSSRGGFGGRRF